MFKNNQACKTMETWIDNLQKKDKVEYENIAIASDLKNKL